ncbi:MAG: rane protein [Moraxellaceae bacterium]|jgi:hypothetical protein|nr:rane protein [Moraxellaceae bacterium]
MHAPRLRRLALTLVLVTDCSPLLAEELSTNLHVNGFGTAGFTSVTEDFGGEYLGNPLLGVEGIDEDGSFSFDNVLGLQVRYQADERLDLVGQLVSVGREDYDTRAEWAYAAYRVNDNLRLRAGRFAMPLYLYSENIHVGQAYPWARLPVEVYATGAFSNVDGVDALYRMPMGDWGLDLQALVGRQDVNELAFSATANNLYSVNATLGNDAFRVRASYSEAEADFTFSPFLLLPAPINAPFPPIDDEKISFSSLGMTFDDGRWFAAAEAIQFRFDGWTADREAAFASVGHYFGKWMPYVMVSKANAVEGDECRSTFANYPPVAGAFGPAAPVFAQGFCSASEQEQTSYSTGFRYDISPRSSLKLQVDHVTDFHGTPGHFTAPATPTGTLGDDDRSEIITVNLNTAF